MKKRKSVVAFLVAMCMVAVSLAGCGNGGKATEIQGSSTADQSEANEAAKTSESKETDAGAQQEQDVELSILVMFDPQTGSHWKLDTFEEAAEALGYKVNVERVDDETYKTKIRVMLQANELPDLFYTWGGSYSEPFIAAEALQPLDAQLETSGYELYDTYKEKEVTYAVPTNALETYCMFYNKDVLNELGLDPPTDWDELLTLVEACNEKGIGAIGLGNKDRWEGDLFYNMMVVREDADAFANAVQGGESFTDEAFLTAAEKVETLVSMNAFQSGYMQASQPECAELLKAGKIAIYPTGSWELAVFEEEGNIGCTVFPKTGAEDPYLSCCGNASDAGMAVNANSANVEAATKLAVEYSKRLNDHLVAEGEPAYFETDIKPNEQSEMMSTYVENLQKMQKSQLWWFTYLDTSIGEPMRDLSHQQFAGQVDAQSFVDQLQSIIKQ